MRRAVFALLAIVAGCATPRETPVKWPTLDGKPPLIIAHRGASGYLPEHTLEAYALAIEQGADVVEPDLVFTKDGVLIARHDRYLSTTTNVADKPEFAARRRANDDPADTPREDWWVEDFTLAELKTLRARQPFPGRSKEHDDKFEIPTFAEMLSLVTAKAKEAGRPVGVYPETKHPAYFASVGLDFESPLLKALEGFDAGPVFIQSFEPEILKRLKGKTAAKLVQLVFEETPGAGPNIPLETIATYADGVGASKNLNFIREDAYGTFNLRAHGLGLFVHFWTFRDDQPNAVFNKVLVESGFEGQCDWLMSGPVLCKNPEGPSTAGAGLDIAAFELEYVMQRTDGVFADFPDTAVKRRSRLSESIERWVWELDKLAED